GGVGAEQARRDEEGRGGGAQGQLKGLAAADRRGGGHEDGSPGAGGGGDRAGASVGAGPDPGQTGLARNRVRRDGRPAGAGRRVRGGGGGRFAAVRDESGEIRRNHRPTG